MNKQLLQSEEWKEFQEAVGRKAFSVDGVFVYKYTLPMGMSYLYSPRITNYEFPSTGSGQDGIKDLKTIALKEKAIFLRVDSEENIEDELKKFGFVKAKKEIQPKDTLILDISGSEEDILKQMHSKTRYNIRLAERKGVTIRQSIDLEDVDKFYSLMEKTTARDGFSAHPREYYRKQVEVLDGKDLMKVFLAEFEGQVIAGTIVSFSDGRATYLHGASDNEHRNLMAPHLLQWEAIKEARKRGCVEYDFWGIAPSNADSSHSWAGITRFKRGFGGIEKNYIGTWDYVLKPFWYKLYNLFSK